jgi:cephalosporin hydroxylase
MENKDVYVFSNERYGSENKYSKIAIEANELYYYMYQDDEVLQVMEFLDNNLKSKNGGFIEIGSALGGSFHCWGNIIKKGKKISVDLALDESNTPYPPMLSEIIPTYIERRVNIWKETFTDVHQILGDSMDINNINKVEEILNGEKVDFLFIDGNHSYEYHKGDFNNYSKFVRDGGYIAIHDIFGQYRHFWHELLAEFPEKCVEIESKITSENDDRHSEVNKDGLSVKGPGIGIYKK